MRVWRRTRTEMAGAWRSLRYDMGRRPFEAPADGPDVTSTGMSTFAGMSWDYGPEPTEMPVAGRMPAPRRRTPRRAVAMSAFGLLTVVGAAGSYLVVVNGLVPMRDEGPAAAATVPPVAPATADAAIGPSLRSPRVARTSSPADPAPVIGTRPPRRTDVVVAPLPPPRTTKPLKPTRPDCRCGNPPVPTPTAPASSPSPTPSAPMSPSASASNSDDPSADPSESPEPRKSWKSGHHRRPH
jgi:hypothetical protein